MSDVGLFPPGAALWFAALAILSAAGIGFVGCLSWAGIHAMRRKAPIWRHRAYGYGMGAVACAVACALTMWLLDLPAIPQFAHWADGYPFFFAWIGLLLAAWPLAGWRWNLWARKSKSPG